MSARAWSAVLAAAAAGTLLLAQSPPLSHEDAKKLKNPIPYSKSSIGQGRATFVQNCTGCHGENGKATVIPDATDLTHPQIYKDGSTEGEIFRSIKFGAGSQMPPFKYQMKDDEIWHLVNFVRSLWPESIRPQLQSSKKK